jgi:hypothetical protein
MINPLMKVIRGTVTQRVIAAAILVGVPAHWKRMTEASMRHIGWWGGGNDRQPPEFPTRFLPGKDCRAPSGMTGRVSRV